MVETVGLTKRYGELTALDDCSLEVPAGEVCGLLGPNGAGKTTLIRMLLGLLTPTSGTAHIAGLDCFRQSVDVRRRVAYLPAEAKLFRRMRAREVLEFLHAVRGDAAGVTNSLKLAGRLDLDLQRRVALMSTGMRQKLALAATLAQDTDLLILDEPTANLDPNVRAELMRILHELRAAGRTMIFCSHVLPEIEEACDRAIILRQGRIVHSQRIAELRKQHRIVGRTPDSSVAIPDRLRSLVQLEQQAHQVAITAQGPLEVVLPWISELRLTDMTIEPTGLRSVYDQYHQSGVGG